MDLQRSDGAVQREVRVRAAVATFAKSSSSISGGRHADLFIALAHAMGLPLDHFGDVSGGPLSGV